jgi:hypothetical protein
VGVLNGDKIAEGLDDVVDLDHGSLVLDDRVPCQRAPLGSAGGPASTAICEAPRFPTIPLLRKRLQGSSRSRHGTACQRAADGPRFGGSIPTSRSRCEAREFHRWAMGGSRERRH